MSECQRCDVEGRCAEGRVIWYDSNGPHWYPCSCRCHKHVQTTAASTTGTSDQKREEVRDE